MTHSALEISNAGGNPVEFYEFRYGSTYWRYNTGDISITRGLNQLGAPAVWAPKSISRDGITQGGSEQNELELTVQKDLPIASLFQGKRPSGRVWLTLRESHYDDPDLEFSVRWVGSVSNAVSVDPATTRLVCRSIAGSYDRNGLRLTWDRMCPHALYGVGCNIPASSHNYPRVIATLTGTNFTCTAHAEPVQGSFTGGFLEYIRADGSLETMGILKQTGNDFRVLGSTAGLAVATVITLYPGCARNTTNCKLFGNLANYGGFPHMPGKSPFDGTPVF